MEKLYQLLMLVKVGEGSCSIVQNIQKAPGSISGICSSLCLKNKVAGGGKYLYLWPWNSARWIWLDGSEYGGPVFYQIDKSFMGDHLLAEARSDTAVFTFPQTLAIMATYSYFKYTCFTLCSMT